MSIQNIIDKCLEFGRKYLKRKLDTNSDIETKKSKTVSLCRICEGDSYKCTCLENECPLCGIFISDLQQSKEVHLRFCKNSNKLQCKKCFKYYSRKVLMKHSKLPNCKKVIGYRCVFCGELFNKSSEHIKHLQTHHQSIFSLRKKLEKMIKESNPQYIGSYPWDNETCDGKTKSDIFKMYVYHADSIFRNSYTDSYLICEKMSLAVCPNIALNCQLINKVTQILLLRKLCFKINLYPSYILQHKVTGQLKFFEHYINFSLFPSPVYISKNKDIKTHFSKISYDILEERMLCNRPSTRYQTLLLTSCHFDVTYTDTPIGGNVNVSKTYVKYCVSIPTSKKNDCFFRCLSYIEYCESQNLNFPSYNRWYDTFLTNNQKVQIELKTNLMCKRWYKYTNGKSQIYLKNIPTIEKLFGFSVNIYQKYGKKMSFVKLFIFHKIRQVILNTMLIYI